MGEQTFTGYINLYKILEITVNYDHKNKTRKKIYSHNPNLL